MEKTRWDFLIERVDLNKVPVDYGHPQKECDLGWEDVRSLVVWSISTGAVPDGFSV